MRKAVLSRTLIAAVFVGLLFAGGLVVATTHTAAAQAWPVRPITVVVPFAAGGGNDILARLLGTHMGRALGQQFVVENRGGAAGTIGARAVAKSAPDGYTIMVSHSGLFAMAPGLYGSAAGFDPRKDFAPISGIASYQQVLVVNPSFPAKTLPELLAMARQQPGKITYATAGIGSGSHVSTELFTAMADVKLTHVPYRGSGPAVSDLVGGHVAMGITTIPPAIAQIRSGLLRAIAVTGDTRLGILPELPTIAEAGVPGYVAVIHYSMVAPAGTPRPIVDRLNAELRMALKQEDVRARIADEGGDVLVGTPDSLAADIDSEETKWGALVRKLGLKPE